MSIEEEHGTLPEAFLPAMMNGDGGNAIRGAC
jgi:hypothetical protein